MGSRPLERHPGCPGPGERAGVPVTDKPVVLGRVDHTGLTLGVAGEERGNEECRHGARNCVH